MSPVPSGTPEVFSAREIALAAGVSTREVRQLVANGSLPAIDRRFVRPADAIHIVKAFRALRGSQAPRDLFRPYTPSHRLPAPALAASTTLHGLLAAAVLLLSTLGVSSAVREVPTVSPMRLVFVPVTGPGGGGGGGGARQPALPPKAELAGTAALRSPVPPPRPKTTRPPEPKRPPVPPVRLEPTPKPADPPPPPPKPDVAPEVVAPVATVAADTRDRTGIPAEPAAATDSAGPGSKSGAGTGSGAGMGEGSGPGIGAGEGGGTGGGPYRPGSGITPPSLLREVRPDYTDEGRRRGISGDVLLEVVVRRDGTIGDVKLLQGLGAGLDQRAIEAVRGWRFSPARRFGTPVDVIVEVAVEFKLR